jgi:Legume lectin domain/Chitobiase/beta-hexosaminidase C-terminal domain/PQQ-like domain
MRTVDGFVVSLLCFYAGALHAQVNVTTYHNDNSRTGQNTQETILTPSNVNSTQFGKLFSTSVDGAVYAQPLYLSNLAIGGGTHNVAYVATEHDSVYAIDADTGGIYSHVSLIAPGGTTPNSLTNLGCGDLVPEVGITGTPAIDNASGTLYVVAKSLVGGNVVQYLHALDVASLTEKFGGPVVIQGSVVGTASDGNGSTLAFNPTRQHQRAALLLENGHVVIGWGSHCDNLPFHGWAMSYSASTLAQEAVFNTSPNGMEGGVWMSGDGPAADANGYIYVATGNGPWDGSANFGDSILKLGPPANTTFAVIDYFTPHNQSSLDTGDIDVAAGGLVLLPPLPSGHQLLAQQSKEGTIYLVDTGNLGKYCVNQVPACTTNDPQIIQEIQSASPGVWGSPTYWNGNVYWTGANDTIKAYSFNASSSGQLSTTPTSHSQQIFPFSSPTPTVSSNGTQNGILWALDGSADDSTCGSPGQNCLGLYAYDATNLGNLLYISTQAANNRDSPGSAVKFEKPIVANGKVYVGTVNSLSVYGLLSTQLTAAMPTISPGTGTYGSAQTVTISDATTGAAIHYTTDGTLPNASSTPYSGAITVSAAETLQAIAVATGYRNSVVASAAYTFGSAPVINDPTGFASAAGLSLRGGATLTNGTLQLTDGGPLEARAVWYATPVNVQSFTTDFDFLLTAAVADGFTFTLQNSAAGTTALGGAGSGLGYQGIGASVAVKFDLHNNAGEGIDSTGFYVNGAIPTVPAVDMSASGVNLHSGDVMHAHLAYDGATLTLTLTDTVTAASFTTAAAINIPGTVGATTAYAGFTAGTGGSSATQSITNWTYASISTVATPTFSPGTGTYGSAQTVTISDATAGAAIHYTTDGTTPSASSTPYSGAITVSAAETVEALAVATGYRNSVVASATYTFGSTPVINDPTGFASAAGLSLRGGATLTNGTLQLTDGGQLEARAVWYATPVNVQSFTTDFDFLLTAAVADGFTFTLQNSAAGTTALGGAGSGLGYQGIGASVAVKFDLHNNAGEGIDSTGFYVNGATPTVPAVDMSASGVNLHSGDVMHAHLAYDGATLTLTLTDTATAASFTTAAAINIPGTVGATTAYAGFTAGTGGSSATQSIMNWMYTH